MTNLEIKNSTTLLIGMPVYNGENFLKYSIESLIKQSFTDWELLISDNASSDRTAEICLEYAKKDKRIKYIKQRENIGAARNFTYLLEQAQSNYFMWAACDDIWEELYLEKTILHLNSSTEIDFVFCNLELIDKDGQYLKSYPNFANFLSSDKHANVMSFLLEPEPFGKSNIIYSMYRVSSTRDYLVNFLHSEYCIYPVSDMAIICGLFCRYNFAYVPDVLFKKRILDPSYSKIMNKPNSYPDWYFIDHKLLIEFANAISYAAKNTDFEETCRKVIEYRLLLNKSYEQYFLRIRFRDVFHIITRRFKWYISIKKRINKISTF